MSIIQWQALSVARASPSPIQVRLVLVESSSTLGTDYSAKERRRRDPASAREVGVVKIKSTEHYHDGNQLST